MQKCLSFFVALKKLENQPWTLLKFSCTARNKGPEPRGSRQLVSLSPGEIQQSRPLCPSTWRTRWLCPAADSGSRLCFCTAYYLLLPPFSDGRLESARRADVAENSGWKTSSTPQSGAMHRNFSGGRDSLCETSRSESGTASLIEQTQLQCWGCAVSTGCKTREPF